MPGHGQDFIQTMGNIPVLFLPGTLCTQALFKDQISALEPLAPSVEVVQFTHESSINEMAALVAQRTPAESGAAIVGFSMGGMVAMALARQDPGLIAKLALLNTNHHAELPGRHAARLKHLEIARTEGMETLFREHYLPRYLYRQDPAHQRVIVDMAIELGADCFENQVKALATRPDSGKTLQAINCPTLILGSSEDELCPARGHVAMNRLVKGSELVLLEACGHFSTLEQPEAVNQALCGWYLRD